MRRPYQRVAATAIVLLLILGSINLFPLVRADDAVSEKVPAPQITEFHNYNMSESYNGQGQGNFDNEEWGISISNGNMITRIAARNYSNTHGTYVDYSLNLNFYLEGKFYIAMFTVDQVALLIGNDTLIIPLRNCAGFEMSYSPVTYQGAIPTMDCNITFRNIRADNNDPGSAFDLTLINHIREDWTQTGVKVEALLDFTGTELGDHDAGETFTAEIHYIMQLTDPSIRGSSPEFNTIRPSKYTDTAMEYNLKRNDGTPYSLSKLEMMDSFAIYNESGSSSAMGYSRIESPNEVANNLMQYNPNTRVVTHGFPGLIYKDTLSMKSDPELTIYHDRATDPVTFWLSMIGISAVIAIGAVEAIIFVRRKRRPKDGEKD